MIAVDWGTSAFRAYRLDAQGRILDRRSAARGILTVEAGGFANVLAEETGAWLDEEPGSVFMSGMIGSRQGWKEVPYLACPVDLQAIARACGTVDWERGRRAFIVPGVSCQDAHGVPDVMRGEETQILGALAAERRGEGIFVLPGTHSKWARVEGGRIIGFETYMTGEAFAALKDHTVLGRMMAPPTDPTDPTGFALGVDAAAALERPGDLLHAAFMTRTFGLFGQLPPDQLAEYLSGLFVGAEILAGARGARAATVIGAPALVERYRRAGVILGVELTPAPANCATLGQIAVLKGAARAAE
jgi:2-dehydro-3-deoxygalactonokinase